MYFRSLAGLTSFHTRTRALHLLRLLKPPLLKGPVLELGFGDGYLLLALARLYPDMLFEGWEVSQRQVREAQTRAEIAGLGNVLFRTGDITAENTPPRRFSCIFSVDVLEHIPDDHAAVRGMARLLSPGGNLCLHVPLRRSLQRRFLPGFSTHTDPGHVREEYTGEELRALASQAGLENISISGTFGPWGEVGFECNSLFWRFPALDRPWRLATLPFLLPLGLLDVATKRPWNNSLILLAQKKEA